MSLSSLAVVLNALRVGRERSADADRGAGGAAQPREVPA
jgi:hypothetical protein